MNENKRKIFLLLEDVIDVLIEAGNCTTDEELSKSLDKLFKIRKLLEVEFGGWIDKLV